MTGALAPTSTTTSFHVFFADAEALRIEAETPEEARKIGEQRRPGLKILKCKRIKQKEKADG
ncbi:hypothetical protein [Gellertiella hungarica]|uniref:Helix-turn-helix protein n=1 Tax=Gellertiella hungarica TaxID=1572859 RepID=A0A7W6J8L9_9HYPH|nr:hypothetical protein [Gellertiella hungarica]MBB4066793.1 helix-turn-helix protein [Gellertiella hungarica]